MNQLVAYGIQEWRIRDPKNRKYVALIIKQHIKKTIHKRITKSLHYDFKRGYTKATFMDALVSSGQLQDFIQLTGNNKLLA